MLKKRIKDHFVIILAKLGLDGVAFGIAFIASYYLCFTLKEAPLYLRDLGLLIPVIIIRLVIYGYFKLYSQMWRYTSIYAFLSIIKAATVGTIVIIVIGYFTGYWTPPRSVLVIDWLLVVFLTGSIRLVRRSFLDSGLRLFKFSKKSRNVLIYGAGKAGETLFRNIQSSSTIDVKIIGFIDDNPALHGQYIHDKKILGDRNDLRSLVDKYNIDSIYIAIPRLSGHENRELLKIIRENTDDIQVMTIPGLKDLVDGKVTVNQIRSFNIKDLLRRQPVNLDYTPVKELIQGKTVMVVGGGGSIGSELCCQIAQFTPRKILIIDSCELNCYNIEDGLKNQFPSQDINCILADACNEAYMRMIFDRYRPEIVFHAAAYKHVPLVEVNPWAAISNNIQCTLTLTKLSEEFRVNRFIMISTDKAVRPQGIMGATKRICELITLFRFDCSVTKFIAVRFGNVLGSSGSVIHKFKHQIEQG
ncbi:polysaccharide biosynthesis protein, partial [bacterium]|nr:polysaccharide biosynthesis protein [bacterium]